jgi:seryl-tRNA synthetase
MLEIKFVRQNLAAVEAALAARGQNVALDTFKTVDGQHRKVLQEIEDLRHRRNVVSEEIARLKQARDPAETLVAEMRSVSARIKELEKTVAETQENLSAVLMGLPNLPHASVPLGRTARKPVVKTWAEPTRFDFKPRAHWEVGAQLKVLDLERAAKIAERGFLCISARAPGWSAPDQLMLDVHTREHGYREVLPPFIVNRRSMTNTGQLPKFEQDLFKLEQDYFRSPRRRCR